MRVLPHARGLHSSTSQLNLSALYGIGGACRGPVARVKGVLGGVEGVLGIFVCQTRLKWTSVSPCPTPRRSCDAGKSVAQSPPDARHNIQHGTPYNSSNEGLPRVSMTWLVVPIRLRPWGAMHTGCTT